MTVSSSPLCTSIYWVLADVSEKNAGYRLRILPLTEKLIDFGVNIRVISEQELAKNIKAIAEEATTVIASKPANTTIFLCLKYLSKNKVNIIIDLFDNYFSWSPTIFQQGVYWNWLRVLQIASKVFVSTPFLQNTLTQLGAPETCLIPDPVPNTTTDLPTFFENGKWDTISQIEFLWFGINSNPYYQAGLEDLISWLRVIKASCSRLDAQYRTRLTICTKRVPEVEITLAVLRQNGIYARFIEWDQETCNNLLENSHVVLIPTNLTGFSLSKTFNRCSDALTRGCLVLGSPNGPYQNISGGVFLSVDGICRLILSQNKNDIQQCIQKSLDFIAMASENNLLQQISYQSSPISEQSLVVEKPVFVVSQTRIETVKLSRILGYLVASFKGSGVTANFDIFLERFDSDSSTITLKLSDSAFNYFTTMIVNNIDLEWQGSQKNLLWTKNGWTFKFDQQTLSCRIDSKEFKESLIRLEVTARINQYEPYHESFWYTEQVKLLCQILVHLGVNSLDFAGDGYYGWKEFAEYGDPNLNNLAQNLKHLWLQYQSNEIQLGRPKVKSTCHEC